VRLAIEKQMDEVRGVCLSILDFSHVGVVDFSCADEVIAKLLLRHRDRTQAANAFFVAHGVSDHHRDPIEAVLHRHGLLLVAVGSDGHRGLWGPVPGRLEAAWLHLDELGRADPQDFAAARGLPAPVARSWLGRLVAGRVAMLDGDGCVCSLCSLLEGRGTAPP
jgi:hypothetical protein